MIENVLYEIILKTVLTIMLNLRRFKQSLARNLHNYYLNAIIDHYLINYFVL